MPPKKTLAAGASLHASSSGRNMNGKSATDADLKFVDAIFSNLISRPDVDWEAVAFALGLKDTKCTKERWRQIKNKFSWDEGRSAASTPRSKVIKRTPRSTGKARTLASTAQAGWRLSTPAQKDMVTPEADSGDATAVDWTLPQTPRPRKKLPDSRPHDLATAKELAEIKAESQTEDDASIV